MRQVEICEKSAWDEWGPWNQEASMAVRDPESANTATSRKRNHRTVGTKPSASARFQSVSLSRASASHHATHPCARSVALCGLCDCRHGRLP